MHNTSMEGDSFHYGHIIPTDQVQKQCSAVSRDGLGEIETRYPDITIDGGDRYVRIDENRPAYDLASEAIYSRPPRSMTYISLGPLTSLATLARKDPVVCRERLGRVVTMGGAIDVPGNDTPVGECTSRIQQSWLIEGVNASS